jgi:shikimate dehydrogenase
MGRPYAEVIGDPIAQSKSPAIHNFWLGKLGIAADYRACHVRMEELADYFARRRGDTDWLGCNVTMPHKLAALHHADSADPLVRVVGAANTMISENGNLIAYNTDVDGILAALPESLMPPESEVCILGTGGAARAAFAACKRRGIWIVLSSARNREAGKVLLEQFKMGGSFKPLEDAHNVRTAEVIINATSLGMTGHPPMPVEVLEHLRHPLRGAVVFDMVYSPLQTEFLRSAASAGCRTVDGLTMLIGQAAAAFEKFFGQPAPREHDAELRALLTA